MEPLILLAPKPLLRFPKMKPIHVLPQVKGQRSYQRDFVKFVEKLLKLMEKSHLRYGHRCAIISYYSLLTLFLVFNLQNFEANLAFNLTIAALQISPLLPFVRGLHALHFRSIIWLCFLSLIYFVDGVMKALSGVYSLFGWGEIILSLMLFVSLTISAGDLKKS